MASTEIALPFCIVLGQQCNSSICKALLTVLQGAIFQECFAGTDRPCILPPPFTCCGLGCESVVYSFLRISHSSSYTDFGSYEVWRLRGGTLEGWVVTAGEIWAVSGFQRQLEGMKHQKI